MPNENLMGGPGCPAGEFYFLTPGGALENKAESITVYPNTNGAQSLFFW